MSKILKSTDIGKSIILNNNSSRKELQNENEVLEKQLLLEEQKLSELRKTIPSKEFRPKAIEFDKKVTIIRKQQAEKETELNNIARAQEAEFYKRIYPLLYELLSDRGGTVLIDQRNLVLWDSTIDLTSDAIELINTEIRNGL